MTINTNHYTDEIKISGSGVSSSPPIGGVAALRLITPISGKRIPLAYHTTAGDGGHGEFRGVTGAAPGTYVDNGGTIIVPTGGDGSAAWLRDIGQYVNWEWFLVTAGGVIDNTTQIQAAIDAASSLSLPLVAQGGTYLTGKISIPSNMTIICLGKVTLKAKPALNDYVIVNSAGVAGNTNIKVFGKLAIDGDYTNQTSGSGILFDHVTNSYFEHLEAVNCYAHGILLSESDGNIFDYVRAVTNGKNTAGYGCYLFNSNSNKVLYSYTQDNCIGVAIEASGAGKTANKNYVGPSEHLSNREAFSQSGAGVHIEQSVGGDAGDNTIDSPDCRGSTGTGITLSGVDSTRIINPIIKSNTRAGITGIQSTNITITGGEVIGNASGEPAAYDAQIRFDDTGLSGCSGRIIGLRANGSALGAKTFTTGCAVQFVGCNITGTTSDYVLTGTKDAVSGPNGNGYDISPQKPGFRAGKTAALAAAGVLIFDSVNHDNRGDYNNGTGVFTAPVTGVYQIDTYATDGIGARISIQLRVNTVAVASGTGVGGGAAESEAAISTSIKLTAGDVVDVYLAVGTTAAGTLYNQFSCHLVG